MASLIKKFVNRKEISTTDIDQAKKDFLPPPGWKRNPVLLQFKKLDELLSYKLALAADTDSVLGGFRGKLRLFEFSAHTLIWFGVVIFCWWMSIAMSSKALFTNLILGMFIDVFVVAILKSAFRRRRPGVSRDQYADDPSSGNLSFPSGFVSRFTMTLFALQAHDFSPVVSILVGTWGTLMLVTKLFLARFFISDAIAGIPVGFLVFKFMELIWLGPEDVISLEAFFAGQLRDD